MFDKGGVLFHAGAVEQRHAGLRAGVTGYPFGTSRSNEGDNQPRRLERLADLDQQHVPAVDRQALIGEHRFAKGGILAVALGDAAKAQRRDGGGRIGDEHRAGRGVADLGNRRGQRHRHVGTCGNDLLDRRLARCDAVDQVGIGKQRRARQHDRRYFRLVRGKRRDDLGRRVAAHRQRLGDRQANLGGRIVEQQRQRGFRRTAILEGQVAVDIGAQPKRAAAAARSATFAVFTHLRKWLTTVTWT